VRIQDLRGWGGADHGDPITGIWGVAPSRIQGQIGIRGAKKAFCLLSYKMGQKLRI